MNKILSFTDLIAWQENHKLVLMIYQETRHFPKEESFSLTDQIRRASVPITSNIAEGFGRHTTKEKLQYYYQAHGSLSEVKNQLIIAKNIGYISKLAYEKLFIQANTSHQLLQGLITKTQSFLSLKS